MCFRDKLIWGEEYSVGLSCTLINVLSVPVVFCVDLLFSSQRWFILQRMNTVTPYLVVWSSLLSDNVIRQCWDTLREDNELLLLSKLFYLIRREGLTRRAAVPSLLAPKGGHSLRFLCSHAPCSAVPGTHHTRHQEQRLPLPPPCLLTPIWLQHAVLKLNEASILPCGVVCHGKWPILLRFEEWSVHTGVVIPKP